MRVWKKGSKMKRLYLSLAAVFSVLLLSVGCSSKEPADDRPYIIGEISQILGDSVGIKVEETTVEKFKVGMCIYGNQSWLTENHSADVYRIGARVKVIFESTSADDFSPFGGDSTVYYLDEKGDIIE